MQLIQIQNPNHLVDIIQSLAAGSFEKKYGSMNLDETVNAFAFATQGMSQAQLNQGIATMLDMGFCPDAVLFRRWCLGQKTFDNRDAIADSYIGKSGALANIQAWLNDPSYQISIAEKQAYDKTYHAFANIQTEFDKNQAYASFKDMYEFIVNERVAAKLSNEPYIAPVAITQNDDPTETLIAKPEFIDDCLNHMMKRVGLPA